MKSTILILMLILLRGIGGMANPMVEIYIPTNKDTEVEPGRNYLMLQFNQPVKTGTGYLKIINTTQNLLFAEYSVKSANIELQNVVLKIWLDEPLGIDQSYQIIIDKGFIFDSLKYLPWMGLKKHEWKFRTKKRENEGPSLLGITTRKCQEKSAQTLDEIVLTFNEFVFEGLGFITIIDKNQQKQLKFEAGDPAVHIYDNVVEITNLFLEPGLYEIRIDEGFVTDFYINLYEGTHKPNNVTIQATP